MPYLSYVNSLCVLKMEESVESKGGEPVASEPVQKVERSAVPLNVTSFRSPQNVADMGRECTALHHVFGMDMSRKGNLNLIEEDTIMYATTSAVVFQNVGTAAKEYLMSISDFGIGCVAIHPSK